MQVLVSFASFFPCGHVHTPPSRELLHSCSQPREPHKVFAEIKKRFVEKERLVPRSKNRDLTASIPLVRSVIAIGRSVAELALVNTVRARL